MTMNLYSLRSRAMALATRSVGKPYAVRKGASVYRGTIKTCVAVGERQGGMTINAQWEITLETNGYVHGPFTVEKLPR
jgi:hypothetical protein